MFEWFREWFGQQPEAAWGFFLLLAVMLVVGFVIFGRKR